MTEPTAEGTGFAEPARFVTPHDRLRQEYPTRARWWTRASLPGGHAMTNPQTPGQVAHDAYGDHLMALGLLAQPLPWARMPRHTQQAWEAAAAAVRAMQEKEEPHE